MLGASRPSIATSAAAKRNELACSLCAFSWRTFPLQRRALSNERRRRGEDLLRRVGFQLGFLIEVPAQAIRIERIFVCTENSDSDVLVVQPTDERMKRNASKRLNRAGIGASLFKERWVRVSL